MLGQFGVWLMQLGLDSGVLVLTLNRRPQRIDDQKEGLRSRVAFRVENCLAQALEAPQTLDPNHFSHSHLSSLISPSPLLRYEAAHFGRFGCRGQ